MTRRIQTLVAGIGLLAQLATGCGSDNTTDGFAGTGVAGGVGGAAGAQMLPPPGGTGGTGTLPLGGAGGMIVGGAGGAAGTMVEPTGGVGGMVLGGAGGETGEHPLRMDECGLDTEYDGDEYCILPPPAADGFQIHVGPSNYTNPEFQYLLPANSESTADFPVTSTNDHPIHFYFREFRMRNGAHHNIVTANDGGALGLGHRIGTTNRLAEDSPSGGIIAPENEGVGIPLAAFAPINVNLHSINTTDKTQLKEVWINFYYRDEADVTEPVNEMFATGSVTFAIQPHEDTMLGPFSCNVTGSGRMLWMYGHRHANNVRFSAWRMRGGMRDVIYEAKNWEEPLVLEYSTTVTNKTPNLDMNIEGGWNGILDLQAGDQIGWECHVINQTDGVLRFTNNTYTGEMCIVDAELVGANCR